MDIWGCPAGQLSSIGEEFLGDYAQRPGPIAAAGAV